MCTITCAEIYSQPLMSFSPLEYVIVTTSLCHCYPLSMSLCIIYAPFSQCPPSTHWVLYSTLYLVWEERLIRKYLVMMGIPTFVHPLDKKDIFPKFLFHMYTCLYLNCMSEETGRWLRWRYTGTPTQLIKKF